MNVNFKIKKHQWEQQIHKEYMRYKEFIENTNMPNYKIVFINNLKDITYIMETLTYKKPIILNINMGYMLLGSQHCQPTLYHEFTHMWDYYNLFQDKDLKDRKSVLSLYTEYHASQIEFLRFMEFESVSKTKDIHSSDCFYEFDKEETVFEYYDERCKLLSESISNYRTNASTSNYKAVIDSYMYVFGIKSMYDRYVENIELPQIDSIFHQNMINFYPLLQDYSVIELWNVLLKYSELFDKLHILNSLERK